MQATLARHAAAASGVPLSARAVKQSLLPPLVLYRKLLKAHKKYLPVEMKLLGECCSRHNALDVLADERSLILFRNYRRRLRQGRVPADEKHGQPTAHHRLPQRVSRCFIQCPSLHQPCTTHAGEAASFRTSIRNQVLTLSKAQTADSL